MDSSLLSYEERLWQRLFSEAQQALRAGEHDDALRDFSAALNIAEEFEPNDSRLVRSLTGLGLAYTVRKQFDRAQELLERSLALSTKYQGADHPESLGVLKHLALVATNLNKLELADKYYSQALDILEKSQPNSPTIQSLRDQQVTLNQRIQRDKTAAEPPIGRPPAANKPAATKQVTKPISNQPATNQPATNRPAAATNQPASQNPPAASTGAPDRVPATYAPTLSSANNAAKASTEKSATPANLPNSADHDALSGFVIDGRYQMYGRIGEGGMSAIYRGKHLFMERPVAVKILHKHLTLSEKVRERFKQESRTASKLQHPNIVAVHDFGEAHGFFYLVMDYVDGISLADLIKEEERISAERCVAILQQICDGLQHAHENGILHRDLKPSNIMLVKHASTQDFVKIVDFGIAKFMEPEDDEHSLQLTQTGETVGSPLYMSPEQCRGERLDVRSDIYSLGCLAYKALSGVPPFGGNNQIDVYIKHTQVPPPPFAKARPGLVVPEQLEQIILKTLAKNPEDRFSSMNELRGALNLFTAGENW